MTIRQIAEKAGVSRGTVDRVLNGRNNVKPEVRERVLSIASELKYVPNSAGKALAHHKNPILIGIIMPPKDIQFFDEIRVGIDTALKELEGLGIRLVYRYVDNQHSEEGVSAIHELVKMGANGLLFSVIDDSAIREAINHVSTMGIPVITFNSDVENCKRVCFVGQNLYKSGRVAAALMTKIFPVGANILVLSGNLNFHAHRARVEGFKDELVEKGSDYKIVRILEGFDRYSDSYKKIDEALKAHDEIKGIYLATGPIQAALDVIKKQGKGKSIRIISNDLTPATEQALREGKIDFTIVQNPVQQGYRSLRLLYDLVFSGKEPEREYCYTDTQIYIPEIS